MNDQLDLLIRDAVGDILDAAPPVPRSWTDAPSRSTHRVHPTRSLVLIAAIVVIALGIGGFVVLRNRDHAPSPTLTPLVSAPVDTVATTVAPNDPLAGTTGWYLPSVIPNGYQIVMLTVNRGSRAPLFGKDWVRLDPITGAVTARLHVQAIPADPRKPFGKPTPGITVHGIGARLDSQQDRTSVEWTELGTNIEIIASGIGADEAVAAAQLVVVDATRTTAGFSESALPEGFTVPTADGLAPHGAVQTSIDLAPADGSLHAAVSASAAPNFDGDTLDTLSQTTTQRLTVNGIDLLLDEEPVGDHLIRWLDNGMILSVDGPLPLNSMLAFAAGFTASTSADVVAAGEQVTARTLAMPALDEATLTDGTKLSIRTDGRGATAICVEAPVQHCKRQISESTSIGESQDAIDEAFMIDGRQIVFGWRTSSSPPTLKPSTGSLDLDPKTSAVIDDFVRTPRGHFIEVVVPSGELPPLFDYGTPASPGPGYVAQAVSLVDY